MASGPEFISNGVSSTSTGDMLRPKRLQILIMAAAAEGSVDGSVSAALALHACCGLLFYELHCRVECVGGRHGNIRQGAVYVVFVGSQLPEAFVGDVYGQF